VDERTPPMLSFVNLSIFRANPFRADPKFIIREIHSNRMIPIFHPQVDSKWDFKTYHARPAKWRDLSEVRKKNELARKREKELELLASLAEGRRTNVGAILGAGSGAAVSDDVWEQAVNAATK
jgi:hypothetical protein